MAEKTISAATEEKKTPLAGEEIRQEERYLAPPVDIYEIPDGLTVIADLPGVDRDGLDVRVDGGILTIQGKPKHLVPCDPVRTEFRLINFYRQFQLGDEVDQEKITATMKHGVLTINLPRAERLKPKKIQVHVSK